MADKTAEIIEALWYRKLAKTAFQFTLFVRATATTNRPLNSALFDGCAQLSHRFNRKPEEEEEIIVPVPDEEDTTPRDDTSADDKRQILSAKCGDASNSLWRKPVLSKSLAEKAI